MARTLFRLDAEISRLDRLNRIASSREESERGSSPGSTKASRLEGRVKNPAYDRDPPALGLKVVSTASIPSLLALNFTFRYNLIVS
jgi:hypothetical protein